jgi:hypothetical protein
LIGIVGTGHDLLKRYQLLGHGLAKVVINVGKVAPQLLIIAEILFLQLINHLLLIFALFPTDDDNKCYGN